jgi:hypothetical protein
MITCFPARQHRIAWVLVIALLGFALSPSRALGQAPPALGSILEDWKQRQDRFHALSFSWTSRSTFAKGSLPGKRRAASSAPGEAPLKPTPAEDVTHTQQMSLKVKADWIHYVRQGPEWVSDFEKFLTKRYESSFDGSNSRAFYEKSSEDPAVHHIGFVNIDKKSQDITNYEIWPILFHYRPLHPIVGRFAKANWEIVQNGAVLRGRNCTLLKLTNDNNEELCWVDAERQSSILRHVAKTSGYVIQTDVDYRKDERHGWAPSGWSLQNLSPNMQKIEFSSAVRVTDSALNEPIKDEDFRLIFPAGTEVNDAPAKQYYLVKPDESKRIITREEQLRGATYEDYLKTESGMALLPQPSWWRPWVIRSALIALVLVAGYAIWRKYRGTKSEARSLPERPSSL